MKRIILALIGLGNIIRADVKSVLGKFAADRDRCYVR